jgi:hypothetical protein
VGTRTAAIARAQADDIHAGDTERDTDGVIRPAGYPGSALAVGR